MTTLKDIAESKTSVFIKPKESILESLTRDLMTFSFLLLCVFVSKGSSFWTFITGIMFLVFLFGKAAELSKSNTRVFETREDAIRFLKNEN